MKNNRIKFLNGRGISLFLLILLLTLLWMPGLSAQAATEKGQALQAYQNFLKKQSSNAQFAVCYLDNNSVPELVYRASGNSSTYLYLYTCKKGKMVQIEKTWISPGHYYYGYYKKKGVWLTKYFHSYGTGSLDSWDYYKLSNGKLMSKLNKTISTDYQKNKKTYLYQDTSKLKNGVGDKITKSRFTSLLKKMVSSRKVTQIKWYANTAANFKKYLK